MAPAKLVVCTCSLCVLNTFIDEILQEQNGNWVSNRTCQKHRASEYQQQRTQESLLNSKEGLHIAESDDEDFEDTQETNNSKTEHFDGESDEDITYDVGEENPFERT